MDSNAPLHPDEALSRILSTPVPTPVPQELVGLLDAVGRALSHAVPAPMDSPPFDKSAMDGYAVRSADNSTRFRVTETIAAGAPVTRELQRGECMKIMTGAPLPPGSDKVVRFEYTGLVDGWMHLTEPEPLDNVIFRGENARAGSTLLTPRVLGPADIATLAAMGIAQVSVAVPPRVGIIATGTELRLPGETLEPGQIYNSNSYSLTLQARRAGAVATSYGIVRDEPSVMKTTIEQALSENDVVLLSGGVSMGEFDFVPGVLRECGVRVEFHKVRIKPGKPTLFGRTARTSVFGLPGNPASTFVLFELFVTPLIHRLMGLEFHPVVHSGRLSGDLARRIADRVEYVPARIAEGVVDLPTYRGSNHIDALSNANCLIRMDLEQTLIVKGSVVHVRQI